MVTYLSTDFNYKIGRMPDLLPDIVGKGIIIALCLRLTPEQRILIGISLANDGGSGLDRFDTVFVLQLWPWPGTDSLDGYSRSPYPLA